MTLQCSFSLAKFYFANHWHNFCKKGERLDGVKSWRSWPNFLEWFKLFSLILLILLIIWFILNFSLPNHSYFCIKIIFDFELCFLRNVCIFTYNFCIVSIYGPAEFRVVSSFTTSSGGLVLYQLLSTTNRGKE